MTALYMRDEILSVGRIYDVDFSLVDNIIENLPEPYRYRGVEAEKGKPFLLDIENKYTGRRGLYLIDGFYGTLIPVRIVHEGEKE